MNDAEQILALLAKLNRTIDALQQQVDAMSKQPAERDTSDSP